MIYGFLLILKIILFMNITYVEFNSLTVFLISSLFILIIYTALSNSKMRNKKSLELGIYCLLSSILFIDVLHYMYFNTLPSLRMLGQVGQLVAVRETLTDIFTLKNLLMVVDIPFLIYFDKKYKFVSSFEDKLSFMKPYRSYLGASMVFTLLLSLMIIVKADNFDSISNQELFLYHYKDIKNIVVQTEDYKLNFKEELIEDIKTRSNLESGKHTGIGRGKNLIVIQVESLQNFVVGLNYKGQEVTPNLNTLIKDSSSLYFDNYYQMMGKGNTSDAEFSTNNSLYPSMTGPSYTDYEENSFHGLPWILRDESYTAWAFHGYKADYWNRKSAYPAQGFERYVSEEDFDVEKEDIIGFGLNDEKFFKESLAYIKDLDKMDSNPFYAFMISLTSHNPYKMPEVHNVLDLEEDHERTLLGNYLQAIHYTDKQLGSFIEGLKAEGIYDNTVIAIYGDHFGISATSGSNQDIMYDFLGKDYDLEEMQNIPLIIHVPGQEINETISKVGSGLDFLPTILNIMGLQGDRTLIFGRDLLNYEGLNYVAPQVYMIKGSFISDKEILEMSRDGIFENSYVYDRKTSEELTAENYRHVYDQIIEEINLCNYILQNDLLEDILSGTYKLDINYKLNLDRRVKEANGSIAGIEANLESGYNSVVLGLSYDEDSKAYILGKDISVASFVKIMDENENLQVILDLDGLDLYLVRDFFHKLNSDYPKLEKDKIYPISNTFDIHHYLKTAGYEPMANLSHMDLSEKSKEDFIISQDIKLVCFDEEDVRPKEVEDLRRRHIYVYLKTFDINSIKKNIVIDGQLEKKLY